MSQSDEHDDIEFPDDYLDNLARFWPEPREQMHFGGWAATHDMTRLLGLDVAEHALDISCGEGATACWLAKTYGSRMTGVDLLEKAILHARDRAQREGVADLTSFEVASLFALPFPDGTFDVVYGQDPDGLAHHKRADIFRECRRVLRPGGRIGFQHWLLGSDVPERLVNEFDRLSAEIGYGWIRQATVDDYLGAMAAAGFVDIAVEDMSVLYASRMEAMARLANERSPDGLDAWNAMLLTLLRDGYKVGARITARRD